MDELIGEFALIILRKQDDKGVAFLKKHPELVFERFDKDPWLVSAAYKGLLETCRTLLTMGAEVNEKLSDFYALENAIRGGHLAVAQLLLENGADPDLGRTMVHVSLGTDRVAFAKLLIQYGINVNQAFNMFETNTYKTALDWSFKDNEFHSVLRAAGALTSKELLGK